MHIYSSEFLTRCGFHVVLYTYLHFKYIPSCYRSSLSIHCHSILCSITDSFRPLLPRFSHRPRGGIHSTTSLDRLQSAILWTCFFLYIINFTCYYFKFEIKYDSLQQNFIGIIGYFSLTTSVVKALSHHVSVDNLRLV